MPYPKLPLAMNLGAKTFALFAIAFGLYVLSAYSGLYLEELNPSLPLRLFLWPAAGLGLASVLTGGYRVLPFIFFFSFASGIGIGIPYVLSATLSVAHAVQSAAGLYLLRTLDFQALFGRLKDAISFIGVALTVSMIAPVAALYMLEGSLGVTQVILWREIWVGQLLGILTVTPFIVRWLPRPFLVRTPLELVEAFAALLLTGVILYLLFWTENTRLLGVNLVYALLLPFFWMALRIGPRITTLAFALMYVTALLGYAFGMPIEPLLGAGEGEQLLRAGTLLSVIAIIFLILVTIEEERKDAVKSLTKHIRDLETAITQIGSEDRAKSDFLAVLGHELRNPLASIINTLELMKLNKETMAEMPALTDTIHKHARGMTRLIDDLLDISRISRRALVLQREVVNMESIIQHSIETAHPLLLERRHTLSLDLPKEPIAVHGDPIRLEQIVINLLTNAVKYTEPEGKIHLSCRKEGSSVVIEVEDNGIGIDGETLPSIFEPFIRAANSGPRRTGLGIGLSLTKQLVELHHGHIEGRSEGRGRGSKFTVILPAYEGPLQSASKAEEPPLLEAGAPRNILIVDDNTDIANGLSKLLEMRGHSTRSAYTGHEALSAFEEFSPDVVLLDIGLPDIDGYTVASKLKASTDRTFTLIALTGYGQDEDKTRTEEAGFDHHLTKPVGLSDIEALLPSARPA